MIGRDLAKRAGLERFCERLPMFAWPGGYPIFYVDSGGNVVCPDCSSELDDWAEHLIVGTDINYEDSGLYCDVCGKAIESAYLESEDDDENAD